MVENEKELIKFLQIGARLDLKCVALEHVLGLTGSVEGLNAVLEMPELLRNLVSLLNDNNVSVAKDAALSLINIAANEKGAHILLDLEFPEMSLIQKQPKNVVASALDQVFDPNSRIADPCCMILSNLSRPSRLTEKVIERFETSGRTFDQLISIFTKKQFNQHGANLHYLGPVLSNLSQSATVRKYILDKEKCVIQRLLPFTEYEESVVRRGGVVGTLKNCCFETDYHPWLLGDDVDLLPRLLLPLAGGEEFDEEDNDKLPLDLQYLPSTKKREEDPDIRCILLEAIAQLCTMRANRRFVRDKNAYVVLRELHKSETDRKALLACENLVNILIRTEEEIGEDNLKALEVPQHLTEEFRNNNELFLKDN